MSIDEDIGILEEEGTIAKLHQANGKARALLLGVEALERVKHLRGKSLNYIKLSNILNKPLPSEGEEK